MSQSKKIFSPEGFLFAGISAGIKKNQKRDLGLIYSLKPASAVGVFTKNKFLASPVIISRKRLKKSGSKARAILVNSGNANCGLGKRGDKDALQISQKLEKELGLNAEQILLASTGVIGEPLPVKKICQAIPGLKNSLREDGFNDFAQAILTTDTRKKIAFRQIQIQNSRIRILGIAKGAGMIQPDLATMLGFILTDAGVSSRDLKRLLKEKVNNSFNRITVDGDTSTNDTVFALANGASGLKLKPEEKGWKEFALAFGEVCRELAEMIVQDGEGASRWFYVLVKGAGSKRDAEKIARKIANSPLVKTAIYARDPNWGRILASAGGAGVKFDLKEIQLYLEADSGKAKLIVFEDGAVAKNYLSVGEKKAQKLLSQSGFKIVLDLNQGEESFEILTCDLTEKYVKINAEYRS